MVNTRLLLDTTMTTTTEKKSSSSDDSDDRRIYDSPSLCTMMMRTNRVRDYEYVDDAIRMNDMYVVRLYLSLGKMCPINSIEYVAYEIGRRGDMHLVGMLISIVSSLSSIDVYHNTSDSDRKMIRRKVYVWICAGAAEGGNVDIVTMMIEEIERDEEDREKHGRWWCDYVAISSIKGGHVSTIYQMVKSRCNRLIGIIYALARQGYMDEVRSILQQHRRSTGVRAYSLKAAQGAAISGRKNDIFSLIGDYNITNIVSIAQYAAEGGHMDILEEMISRGMIRTDDFSLLAMSGAAGGHMGVVKEMITRYRVTSYDDIASAASEYGHYDIVMMMVNKYHANNYGEIVSRYRGPRVYDIVVEMMRRGVTTTTYGGSMLFAAVSNISYDTMIMVLNRMEEENEDSTINVNASGLLNEVCANATSSPECGYIISYILNHYLEPEEGRVVGIIDTIEDAVDEAVSRGYLSVVKVLLSNHRVRENVSIDRLIETSNNHGYINITAYLRRLIHG